MVLEAAGFHDGQEVPAELALAGAGEDERQDAIGEGGGQEGGQAGADSGGIDHQVAGLPVVDLGADGSVKCRLLDAGPQQAVRQPGKWGP